MLSCEGGEKQARRGGDSLSEEQQRMPEHALAGLTVAEGLEVQLVAAEPMLRNPTNIDVDERGRVWVTEAYNYRPWADRATTPEGDRILILEDTDGDGVTDTAKVFYRGPEINAPLGICVLGNRVLVSQSPYVWAFYDDDGDDRADRKEILFQGIGGEQHDHGMHTFVFGPDGKLYFNFGNEGKTLKDKNGKVVRDQDGDEIGPGKYRQGMVFRCNPDGSEVECLGHNFRNNFEVAVDSYGTMWQSDNDDDGHRGTRINYVMDYGNYGFTDEMTGAGWNVSRTNWEDSIPLRHWHLNDPGVVPNLLQTGSGSPTGMVVYEGTLLPETFRNQMIHCEPGHNVVRAYPVEKDGAGFSAGIVPILTGGYDQWFRPADVCVAPDGSLIVADWYDAIVGGHDAKDQEKGRIYRIAPKGSAYTVPTFDYTTPDGALAALQNPNLAVRRRAWYALHELGQRAVPTLENLWRSSAADPRMRARAFWVLVKMPAGGAEKYIAEAIGDKDPNIRITGIRAARQLKAGVTDIVRQLVNDKDPQVRRECALALRHSKDPAAASLWTQLALQHDGRDRWYLEALGIGADRQWDLFLGSYLQATNDPLATAAGRDIIWRARTNKTLPLLASLATDKNTSWKSRQRYFRAFDFIPGPEKTNTLLGLIAGNKKNDVALNALLLHHLNAADVKRSAVAKRALHAVLDSVYGTDTYITLVKQYETTSEKPRLLDLILTRSEERIAAEAVKLYLAYDGEKELRSLATGADQQKAMPVLRAFGPVGYEQTLDILQEVLLSTRYSDTVRHVAAEGLGRTYGGEYRVFDLVKAEKVGKEMVPYLMAGMKHGPRPSMYQRVEALLSEAAGGQQAPFNVQQVLALEGDAAKGKAVFTTHCALCHQVKGEGSDFGPGLSEIGAKLPREGLLEAIVNPSGGISFGYESWEIEMKNGSTLMGVIASRTDAEIQLKYPGGQTEKIKVEDIKTVKPLSESAMPPLHRSMQPQELADLLSYLSSLKGK